jgi:hypothetical protein
MKARCPALIAFLYFMSSHAYGQGLSGKWETNLAAASGAVQALPAQGQEGQAVVLDLMVDPDNKVSGTVSEIGRREPFNITSGTVTGKTFTFRTSRRLNANIITETWNGEITDDNTLRVTRTRATRLTSAAPRGGPGFGPVPVDPGPRDRGGAGVDLIFHRPQAKQTKPYTGIK